MADVNLEGNVVQEIFMQAINSMPLGAGAIARMLSSKARRRPLNNQQLFDKTCRTMRNMDIGEKNDVLKFATRDYLQKHYGLPVCDTAAYDVKVGRGKITLKYNKDAPGAVPFAFWINKNQLENGTLSEPKKERSFTKLTSEEVVSRINENSKWLQQKEVYKQRVMQLFNAGAKDIDRIFKDEDPGRADFSGCEISGFDFTAYDLSGANFKGARLDHCSFSKIEHADLSEAVIAGCTFAGAQLTYTDLKGTAISNTTFDRADLLGCNFAGSEPSDVSFKEARIKDTNLDFSRPQNVLFESDSKVEDLDNPVAETEQVPVLESVQAPAPAHDRALEPQPQQSAAAPIDPERTKRVSIDIPVDEPGAAPKTGAAVGRDRSGITQGYTAPAAAAILSGAPGKEPSRSQAPQPQMEHTMMM